MDLEEAILRRRFAKLGKEDECEEHLENIKQLRPNPSFPLPFEKYSDDEEVSHNINPDFKDDLDRVNNCKLALFDKEIQYVTREYIKHPGPKPSYEQHEAYILALKAYTAPDPIATADAALALYHIPEAYNVKAMYQSQNYEEALQWYWRTVEEMEPYRKTLELTETIGITTIHNLGTYFRAYHGIANCLRKLGRFAEAEDKYYYLRLITKKFSLHYTLLYGDWRFHIAEVLLKQGKYAEAQELYQSKEFEIVNYDPCVNVVKWTHALLDFVCNKNRGFDEPGFVMNGNENSIGYAFGANPQVLAFLTGKEKLPNAMVPKKLSQGTNSWTMAAEYARAYLSFWEDTPGAVEWAMKNVNTHYITCMMNGKGSEILRVVKIPNNDKMFKKLVKEGVFLDTKLRHPQAPEGVGLLPVALTTSYKKADILLKAGATWTMQMQPLEFVLVNDHNPLCYKVLVEHGHDPYLERNTPVMHGIVGRINKISHVMKVAHMGNARHLHAIFTLRPPSTEICDDVLRTIINSDQLRCLQGGQKCGDCAYHKVPHSPHASMEFCFTALLLTGYKPTKQMCREVQAVCCRYKDKFWKGVKPQMDLTNEELLQKFEHRYGSVIPSCAVCESFSKLQKCCRCRSVYYCGPMCQKQDWKTHKAVCKKKL